MNIESHDDTRASPNGPLAGLTILELHAIGPVPFVGYQLAALGASVCRISPPNDPGLGLNLVPEYDLLAHGKDRLTLDLKHPDGVAALHERLARTDVLLDGFRPGVLARLLGNETALLSDYPRLILGQLNGFGSRGPYAARAGHDINYLALSGALAAIGSEDSPALPLNLVADFGGGAMHLLTGILAALVQRGTTGRGAHVATSILAGTVGLMPMFYGLVAGGAWSLKRRDNLLDGAAPFYRTYASADGGHVAVGALEPKFYATLLEVTGLAGTLDAARQYDRDTWPDQAAHFTRVFAGKTREQWDRIACECDCCLTPVLDLHEAARHAQGESNGWYCETPYLRPGPVIDFPA